MHPRRLRTTWKEMIVDIPKKGNRGKCPHCGKWLELFYNEEMKVSVLDCCTKYSLFPKPEPKKKRKKKK